MHSCSSIRLVNRSVFRVCVPERLKALNVPSLPRVTGWNTFLNSMRKWVSEGGRSRDRGRGRSRERGEIRLKEETSVDGKAEKRFVHWHSFFALYDSYSSSSPTLAKQKRYLHVIVASVALCRV